MRRYKFVVGVNLSALEEELNRIAEDEQSVSLNQVLHAQGTGFVGVLEYPGSHSGALVERAQEPPRPKAIRRAQRRKA
jgi:hypothetical protein